MRWRIFVPVVLCLALLFSGCSGLTIDPASPGTTTTTPLSDDTATVTSPDGATTPDPLETLMIHVSGNGTYTVTATAVGDDNDGVRVHYTDGSAKTYAAVQSRGDLPVDVLNGASRVEPILGGPGMAFATSDGGGGAFGWLEDPAALVYSVADNNGRLLGWDYVDCGDGTLIELAITINESGHVAAGQHCAT